MYNSHTSNDVVGCNQVHGLVAIEGVRSRIFGSVGLMGQHDFMGGGVGSVGGQL